MSPLILIVVLLAGLLALIPVWRLSTAMWPVRWLVTAWIVYAVTIFATMRLATAGRFLVPILAVAFIAPFVVGPERLARLVPRRTDEPRPVIDVTPAPPEGLPDPGSAASAARDASHPGDEPAPGFRARRRSGRGLRGDPPGMDEDQA